MERKPSKPLHLHPLVRHLLFPCAAISLLWLGWQALSGGLRQVARSRTPGQKVETVVQLQCGLLSLLVVLTRFWQRRWASPVQRAWGISLAVSAGLSSVVWGPPMPFLGILFFLGAMVVARAIKWALNEG